MRKPMYTCKKCGWSGAGTAALFPMHPSKGDGPRCPKCFKPLARSNK